MYMKVHAHGHSTIVALCDKENMGKVLRKGGLVLDLKAHAYFYKGTLVSEAVAARALKEADSINLVGKRAVALAKKLGLASDSDVMRIGGVPHVQVYRITV